MVGAGSAVPACAAPETCRVAHRGDRAGTAGTLWVSGPYGILCDWVEPYLLHDIRKQVTSPAESIS
jgi:hypothetical protein